MEAVDYYNLYRPTDYANLKGVNRSRISQLMKEGRLKIWEVAGVKLVKDCPENDALFRKK